MLLSVRSFPAGTRRNGSEIKDFIVVRLQHTSRSFLILAAGLIAKRFPFFLFFFCNPWHNDQAASAKR